MTTIETPSRPTDSSSALRLVDADLPDSALTVDELGSRISGLAGRLAAATCRWLLLVAEFDARDGCVRFGLPSTVRWLSHYCGLSRRTAVDHLHVARALATFPALVEAMGSGRLSYSHVRAIARVAHEDEPQLVADLIELAGCGTVGQLETMVRGLRTVEHNESARPDDEPTEYFAHGWTSQSQWRCHARLAPERGAVVQSAVATIARAEGLTQAEALVRMAEIAVAALNDSARPPRALRGDERAAVVIHLDAAAIPLDDAAPAPTRTDVDPTPTADGTSTGSADGTSIGSAEPIRPFAHIDNGPGLPASVIRRLLCAGRIRTAVHSENGNVCDLGRSHRVVSSRQFRALLLRDRHCAHPGCGSRYGLQAHHVQHWIQGGRTDLNNLVLLCEAHHHAHHDGQSLIEPLGGGRFRFHRADGRLLPEQVDPAALATTDEPIEDDYRHLAADAARTGWNGDGMNYDWAVTCFVQRRHWFAEHTG